MIACLKQFGTIPDVSDILKISVICGNRISRHSFKSEVEIGSRSHDLVLHERIHFLTSSSEIEANLQKLIPSKSEKTTFDGRGGTHFYTF